MDVAKPICFASSFHISGELPGLVQYVSEWSVNGLIPSRHKPIQRTAVIDVLTDMMNGCHFPDRFWVWFKQPWNDLSNYEAFVVNVAVCVPANDFDFPALTLSTRISTKASRNWNFLWRISLTSSKTNKPTISQGKTSSKWSWQQDKTI